jgi:hypothetical protein
MFSTSKHILSVDSRDRDYGSYPASNRYKIQLPIEYKNVVTVKLKGIELPMSYYVFSSAYENTTIRVYVYNLAGTTIESSSDITIPDGNYNIIILEETLKGLLEAAFTAYVFTVTVDPISLKLLISLDANRQIGIDTTVYAKSTPTGWGLGYYLGFDKNTVLKSANIRSPNMVVLNPYNYMLLELNSEFNLLDETGGNHKSAFAKIPLNTNKFDYVFKEEQCCAYNEALFNPPLGKLEKLDVIWKFHDGNMVQFNNTEHSFTLQIECISRPEWNAYRILNIPQSYDVNMLKTAYKKAVSKPDADKEKLKKAFKILAQKFLTTS